MKHLQLSGLKKSLSKTFLNAIKENCPGTEIDILDESPYIYDEVESPYYHEAESPYYDPYYDEV